MTCDRSCLDTVFDKRGKPRPTGTRRYPLDRLCCATALLLQTSPKAREATMRVIEAQVGVGHAEKVREAVRAELRQVGESRRRA